MLELLCLIALIALFIGAVYGCGKLIDGLSEDFNPSEFGMCNDCGCVVPGGQCPPNYGPCAQDRGVTS